MTAANFWPGECRICGGGGPWRREAHADWCATLTAKLGAEARGHGPGCDIEGCARPHHAKGLCTMHYQQGRR